MTATSSPCMFDPICGIWLTSEHVLAHYTYIGHTYVFCSLECRDLFARTPEVHVVRLAHDGEACIAHRCPFRYHKTGVPDKRLA